MNHSLILYVYIFYIYIYDISEGCLHLHHAIAIFGVQGKTSGCFEHLAEWPRDRHLGSLGSQLAVEKNHGLSIQCGAPKIAKLVYNSNNYGLWYL